jgi:hypothetical protein
MKSLFLLLMLCLSLSTTLLAQQPAPKVEITTDEAAKLKAADLLLALLQYSISFDGAFTEIAGEKLKTYEDGTELLKIIKLEKTIQKTQMLMRLPGKSLNYMATFDAAGSQALINAITIEIPKNATFTWESKQTKENETSYYLKANGKKICTLTYVASTGKSDLVFFAGN